jgi:feruloyl-CoA synthase
MGLGQRRPLLILSGNTVNHLLMTLGAMTAGIPVAPVNVAHSLSGRDHARLRAIAALVEPGAVYAEDAGRYAAALDALDGVHAIIGGGRRPGAARLRSLLATRPGRGIRDAFASLSPDSLARIAFEPGPDGESKSMLITHRMLTANQQTMRQSWTILSEERPLAADGLLWSDEADGNQGIDMVLATGGTLHIDDGQVAIRTTGHAVPVVVPWEAAENGAAPAASTGNLDHAGYLDMCAPPANPAVKLRASGPSLNTFRQFAFAFS